MQTCAQTQGDIYILLLLLRSNLSRQHSRFYIAGVVRRRGNTGKYGKVGVKRKWWVLAQPPYSPQGNGRQLIRVELFKQGDRPPDAEENPWEPVLSKFGRRSEIAGTFQIQSRKTRT